MAELGVDAPAPKSTPVQISKPEISSSAAVVTQSSNVSKARVIFTVLV